MARPNENAPGLTPGAFVCQPYRKDEPVNTNPKPAGSTSPPEAPLSLAEALAHSKRPVTLLRPSGEPVSLTGLAGPVALTLIAAGQRGISQPDVQPWCWDLAATIRDLRDLLGNDAIATLRGDRRRRLPAQYRLVEQLSVQSERGE